MAALIPIERYELLTGTTIPEPQRARVTALLEAVSDAIRDECGWHIAPVETDHEITVDGSGGYAQNLPTLHLVAVSSVVEDGNALTIAPATAGGTVTWSERGQLTKGPRSAYSALWTRQLAGVVATIDHGYATCPASLELLLCAKVKGLLDHETLPVGVSSESKGPFSISYGGAVESASIALSDDDRDQLARYVLPPGQGTAT